MQDSTQERLRAMARHNSGATVAERASAKRKLDHMLETPQTASDLALMDSTDVDTNGLTIVPTGMLIMTKGTSRSFLRQSSLEWFLSHVKENTTFSYRSIPYHEKDFGSGDFYSVRNFLLTYKLAEKTVGGLIIKSIDAIRKMWNKLIMQNCMI